MDSQEIPLPPNYQLVVDHFVEACQADARIVAAFLRGSWVEGAPDEYSDLDLSLIISDEAFEDFLAERGEFLRQLGELAFLESFSRLWDTVFFTFPDGPECELSIGHESDFNRIHLGPYKVLVDKKGILEGVVFAGGRSTHAEQMETLRQQINWFWHDLSHFTTAMARGQLWWAYGQLEYLRRYCVTLAHLRHNFSADAEGYDKIEKVLPIEQLSPLINTFCLIEEGAMLRAGLDIVHFYKELALELSQRHELAYPHALDQLLYSRLEKLADARL